MARNVEKANLLFNRWTAMKEEMAHGGPKQRRPYLASECKSLPDADKWRREIIRDVFRKVQEIQNAGLGEARIRDLNDEINKLMREKGHWERQIKVLGGPDYAQAAAKSIDAEGKALPGQRGSSQYRYYGAAKDLPGVRELFEGQANEKPRRTRARYPRGITPDYYGYRDEDDGVLLEVEAAAERELAARAAQDWDSDRASRKRARTVPTGEATADDGGLGATVPEPSLAAALGGSGGGGGSISSGSSSGSATAPADVLPSAPIFRAHVAVPSQKDIEAMIVEKKKQLLLAKYASDQLQAEQQEARQLLNVRSRADASGTSTTG